jgi:hypothetical protein
MNVVQQKHHTKKLHNIFDLGGFKRLLSPSMNPNSEQYVRNYKLAVIAVKNQNEGELLQL